MTGHIINNNFMPGNHKGFLKIEQPYGASEFSILLTSAKYLPMP